MHATSRSSKTKKTDLSRLDGTERPSTNTSIKQLDNTVARWATRKHEKTKDAWALSSYPLPEPVTAPPPPPLAGAPPPVACPLQLSIARQGVSLSVKSSRSCISRRRTPRRREEEELTRRSSPPSFRRRWPEHRLRSLHPCNGRSRQKSQSLRQKLHREEEKKRKTWRTRAGSNPPFAAPRPFAGPPPFVFVGTLHAWR